MMIEKKIKLIFGRRGSGKSYLAKKLIRDEKRILIYDTMSEYTDGVVFNSEQHRHFALFWKHVYRRPYKIIYRPLKPIAQIEAIAQLVYIVGDLCFVVEEIETYCSAFQISDSLAAIVQRGRHKNISLIGIAHRPNNISRLITSQAKEIFIFSTKEPRDVDYLKQLLGKEIEEKLNQLGQYQYVKWTDGKDEFEIGRA